MRSGCEDVPPELTYSLFDAAVNSGVVQARKWLQQALGLEADGLIGPKTRAAIGLVDDPMALKSAYNGIRLRFMASLPTWPSFGKGWARRIADILTMEEG